jgi:REP element-mobilizing transposase RayT
MPRQPRPFVPGYPAHLRLRGVNRQDIFRVDGERLFFIEALRTACAKFGVSVHAYVLMTNHVHLLASQAGDGGFANVMQSLGRRYVAYFNRRHARTGTLWEGRYRAVAPTPIFRRATATSSRIPCERGWPRRLATTRGPAIVSTHPAEKTRWSRPTRGISISGVALKAEPRRTGRSSLHWTAIPWSVFATILATNTRSETMRSGRRLAQSWAVRSTQDRGGGRQEGSASPGWTWKVTNKVADPFIGGRARRGSARRCSRAAGWPGGPPSPCPARAPGRRSRAARG